MQLPLAIAEMVAEGMVTLEKIRVIAYRAPEGSEL
jgi:hypothetical protein